MKQGMCQIGLMSRAAWPDARRGILQTLLSEVEWISEINTNDRAFFLQLTQCCA